MPRAGGPGDPAPDVAATTPDPLAAADVAQGPHPVLAARVIDPSPAAFFDVDNTMMVGASIFHFAKGLAARQFFSWRDLTSFAVKQARLRMRGESRADMHDARDSALAFVAGKQVRDIVELSEQIYDEEMADKVWPGTYELARQHVDAGERVWLVTATPLELAQIIASRLALTGALGTVAETVDGRYTGRLIGDVLHGEAKAAAVRALAGREGLDLARCTAYSDSINDLALLSLVGRAVAVNPDSALRAEAKARGWEIRDFRTGRRAARLGVPAAAGVGTIAAAVLVTVAIRRRTDRPSSGETAESARTVSAGRTAVARTAVSARRNGVAGAGGTTSPGWSRGSDR